MNESNQSELIYGISARLVASHDICFPKVEAHDQDDPDVI